MAFGAVRGTLENQSTSPGTGISATGSIACSVGDLIVTLYAFRTAVTPTVSDNQGGGNHTALNAGTATNGRAYPFYKRVTTAFTLTSVTAAHTSDTADAAIMVMVFEGPFDASPLDQNPAFTSTDNTSPFDCPTSGTLSQADELVLGFRAQGNGAANGNYGAGNSFTIGVDASSGTGANTCSGAIVYRVVSATTSVAPQITASTNTNGNNGTASFKKARRSDADAVALQRHGHILHADSHPRLR